MRIIKFQPLYKMLKGKNLELNFGNANIKIENENGETFDFIPLDERKIIVDLESYKIQNLADTFVFRYKQRHMRLSLANLAQVEQFQDFILPILYNYNAEDKDGSTNTGIDQLFKDLEAFHQSHLIDKYLDARDYDSLKSLSQNYSLPNARKRKEANR